MTGISDLQTMFAPMDRSQESRGTSGVANQPSGKAGARGVDSSPVQDDQRVSVSSTAGALAQVSGSDDVRHEKVAQLRAAITGGTYSVASSEVANKLIDSMLGGR